MSNFYRIAVEGGIGVGKSTLLPRLQKMLSEQHDKSWKVLDERVDEDPQFKKLLNDFYKDPNKQIQLQSWITLRRLQEFQARAAENTHYLFERSFLGEMVFCHANFLRHERPDGQFINFFYNTVSALKQCKYDAVVYLQADPDICFNRIQGRSRKSEDAIPYEYIKYLHSCYDTHLPEIASQYNIPLITVDWNHFGSVSEICSKLSSTLGFDEGDQSYADNVVSLKS